MAFLQHRSFIYYLSYRFLLHLFYEDLLYAFDLLMDFARHAVRISRTLFLHTVKYHKVILSDAYYIIDSQFIE